MEFVDIQGGKVAYDLIGPEDGEPLVLTPGGRFGMDYRGVRPLAEALAEGGSRVLLWDRPNCGHSDVRFEGRTESHMRADTLAELIDRLELGPVVVAGGSGGARDSMLTVMRHPEVASRLVLWNIVGGWYGSVSLASVYNVPSISAAMAAGMAGVAGLPDWQELFEVNPGNRDRLLALDPDEFVKVQLRWMNAFIPKAGQTIAGIDDEEFDGITIPTLIIRGGAKDIHHPKRTSLEVNCLIEGSRLVDPPWPEDAWEQATRARARGEGGIFDPWVLAAPIILDFVRETAGARVRALAP
jgi:2-hydroxy-6-oxonona-2,4-dienedioate hydrolase